MPEAVNTALLSNPEAFQREAENDARETMIEVRDVSMVFNMASETLNSLKEYAIALARHELRFKEFRALNHISLEVKRGDVFGILGSNGSGKSTLLKIVAGVLDPTEGSCSINGSIAPLIELGAGFDLELTARENIYLNGALLGYSKQFIDSHFDEIVDFAEVRQFLDMPLKNYSSGMVARVAFSIATVVIPDILIVDEVLSVGDFMFQQKCERRIQSLINDHGVTVLIVSHDNYLVERLCNKAVWIEKGDERLIGPASDVCQAYRILGGRPGTPDEERKVLDLLNTPLRGHKRFSASISGESSSAVAAKLVDAAGFEQADTVYLAPAEVAESCFVAGNIAGIAGCPLLLVTDSAVPDATYHALSKLQPTTIVVVDGYNAIVPETLKDSLADACNWDYSLRFITAPSFTKLTGLLAKSLAPGEPLALAVYGHCMNGVIALASHFMDANARLLMLSEPQDIKLPEIQALLGSHPCAVFDNAQTDFKGAVPDSAVLLECTDDPAETSVRLNRWAASQPAGHAIPEQVTLSPSMPSAAAFVAPNYAHATGTPCFVYESQNLKDLVQTIQSLESFGGAVQKATFVGEPGDFTEEDVIIISKAICLAVHGNGGAAKGNAPHSSGDAAGSAEADDAKK